MKKSTYNAFKLSRLFTLLAVATCTLQSCDDGDGSPRVKDGVVKEYTETTKGVVTEVEEVEPGDTFKLIDEKIIDDKSESIAIVHNLDQTVDTLSLRAMARDESVGGRSGLRSLLMYGLAASVLNRSFAGTAPSRDAYKTDAAYSKSQGLNNDLKSTARTRRVTVPGKSSRGYGSGRSFRSRSFGG